MFFNNLSQIMSPDTDINITIHRHNETYTVSVLPKSKKLTDEAQNHMQPVTLTGSAEELDAGFFNVITQPVQKATGLLSNMTTFEEALDKVEANRKEAREKKKAAEKQVQDQKKQFDMLVTQAETRQNEGKNEDALKILREARTLATGPDIRKTDSEINRVKAKCLQGSLF